MDTNEEMKDMKAGELFPDLKHWKEILESQKQDYKDNEKEVGLGPEPTYTSDSAGQEEMRQIKKMSRFPYGHTVMKNLNKGLKVLSVTDSSGEESDWYDILWVQNNMDRKFEIAKQDFRISGTFFMHIWDDETGFTHWDILSPKDVTVLSHDRVNSVFGTVAIWRNARNVFTIYTDQQVFTFVRDDEDLESWEDYTLYSVADHNQGFTPIVAIDAEIASDGKVRGSIELLKPLFDTLRQRTNATSQAAYWAGTKNFFIEGLDTDEVRYDPETGEEYNVAEQIIDSIKMMDGGVVLLPTGTTNGSNPTLSQTEEANLVQLVETKKDALRDLAGNTGIPYHIFDGTSAPTSYEASVQAYLNSNSDRDADKSNIGFTIELLFRRIVERKTGNLERFKILWAVSEQISINSIADTVSKLAASGIPLAWIVRNVLAGYRPNQINELLEEIGIQQKIQQDQLSMIIPGVGNGIDSIG